MNTRRILTSILAATVLSITTASLARAAETKEIWEKNCASCHGKDGRGDTKMGRKADVKDYTDAKVQTEMTDEKAIKTIKEGLKDDKGKERMKPYADTLSDEEIKSLIAYIRAFKK